MSEDNKKPYVILCPMYFKRSMYYFCKPGEEEIKKIVMDGIKVSLEELLRNIHERFADTGLQYTLIHKVFDSSDYEIAYFVPELVYVAIRKNCKPMKKLLVFKATNNESLRRLILWNVKAFTVLMKQKDATIKAIIDEFEESLIESVPNRPKFLNSQKAIAMLTQASLTLKKLPLDETKDKIEQLTYKLKKFIKRFNHEYLNTLQHHILIPFRKTEADLKRKTLEQYKGKRESYIPQKGYHDSTMVVRIIEDDCNCFPTRKRVPYRIIIETVDPLYIIDQKINDSKLAHGPVYPDTVKDLFNEVKEIVEATFNKYLSLIRDNAKYPFVVDTEYTKQMKNWINVEKKEMEGLDTKKKTSKLRRSNSMTLSLQNGMVGKISLAPFKITQNENLRKFDAIYIPNLSSSSRRSEMHFLIKKKSSLKRSRLSYKEDYEGRNVKIVYYETIEWNFSSYTLWGQPWTMKAKKITYASIFGRFKSHHLRNVVVKGGDDLRQYIVCMQMIYKMRDIIAQAGIDVLIKPYEIIVLSENSGMLYFVSNSLSIDQMRKKTDDASISKFFTDVFQTEARIEQARANFIKSLAGSSILCYVLKLKDRHNGNILLDIDGNIIHIDFGFILGMSPGNINFYSSPFKLTEYYVYFLGGKLGPGYGLFCDLFCGGMLALRKRLNELTIILEIMMDESDLYCFQNFDIDDFKHSFRLGQSDTEFRVHCHTVIEKSCMNSRTVYYDLYQQHSNNIRP